MIMLIASHRLKRLYMATSNLLYKQAIISTAWKKYSSLTHFLQLKENTVIGKNLYVFSKLEIL